MIVLLFLFLFGQIAFASKETSSFEFVYWDNIDFDSMPDHHAWGEYVDNHYAVLDSEKVGKHTTYQSHIYLRPNTFGVYVNGSWIKGGYQRAYMYHNHYYVNLKLIQSHLGIVTKIEKGKLKLYRANRELICKSKTDGKEIKFVPFYQQILNIRDVTTKGNSTYISLNSLAGVLGANFKYNDNGYYEFYTDAFSSSGCVDNKINASVEKINKPTVEQISNYLRNNLKGFIGFLPDGTKEYVKYKVTLTKGHGTVHGTGMQQYNKNYQKQYQEPHDFRITIECDNQYDYNDFCSEQGVKIFKLKEKQEIILKSLVNKFPNTKFFGKTRINYSVNFYWSNYDLPSGVKKSTDGFYKSEYHTKTKPSSFRWDDFVNPPNTKNITITQFGNDLFDEKSQDNYYEITWGKVKDDNSGVDGYEIYLDGKYHSYTKTEKVKINGVFKPKDKYGYDGRKFNTIKIKTKDKSGNVSGGETTYKIITNFPWNDYEAPSVPQNLREVNKGTDFVDITWDLSTDKDSGVDGYEIWVDSVFRLYKKESTLKVYNMESKTSFFVEIKAKDKMGNVSKGVSGYFITD
jgi:hypothetical protein